MTAAGGPRGEAPRVVGLGESMLRLSTPGRERLEQAASLRVDIGGAEMNALAAAAALGCDAVWLTRLADNPLGARIAAHARAHAVRPVVDWDGEARAPLYFVEHGADPRPAEVLYDRSASAMTALGPGAFDWHEQVRDARAVVCGGITCALGDGPARAVGALLDAAHGAGAVTLFDVNHRDRLWTWEQAVPVLRRVLPRVEVLSGSRYDLARLLGEDLTGLTDEEVARRAARDLGPRVLLLRETVRRPEGRVSVSVRAATADGVVTGGPYEAEVVDAFGGGDAATGAVAATLASGGGLDEAVDLAAWACALQHTIPGDTLLMRPAERHRRQDPARRILR
jgi:2-dehydro-3-deoxygluconokinase